MKPLHAYLFFQIRKYSGNKEVVLIPDLDAMCDSMWRAESHLYTSSDFTLMKILHVQRHFGPECISRGLEVLLHVFFHLLNLSASHPFSLSPLLFTSVHFCSLHLVSQRSHNDQIDVLHDEYDEVVSFGRKWHMERPWDLVRNNALNGFGRQQRRHSVLGAVTTVEPRW